MNISWTWEIALLAEQLQALVQNNIDYFNGEDSATE